MGANGMRTIPRQSAERELQASRRFKSCPEPLASVIKFLGNMPVDEDLKDIEKDAALVKVRREMMFSLTGQEYEDALLRAEFDVLLNYLEELYPSFKTFILDDFAEDDIEGSMNRAIKRYRTYRITHRFMRRIVEAIEDYKINPREASKEIPIMDKLRIEDGIIQAELASLTKAVHGVEAERIRICGNKNCRSFFWAGRISKSGSNQNNQVCCTPQCAHAYRNQRYRAKYKDPKDKYKSKKLSANERSQAKRKEGD